MDSSKARRLLEIALGLQRGDDLPKALLEANISMSCDDLLETLVRFVGTQDPTNPTETIHPLLKYSYKPKGVFEPGEGGILQRTDGDWQPPEEGIFLAPARYKPPTDAETYLALTYEPRYLYEWPSREVRAHEGSDQFTRKDAFGNEGSFNRVWPAFGRDGGGLETILLDRGLTAPQPTITDGNEADDWILDSTSLYYADEVPGQIPKAIVGAQDGFRLPGESPSDTESEEEPADASAKVQGNRFASTTKTGHWYLTVSCAHSGDEPVRLKLWAALWRDFLGWRQLYWAGPKEVNFAADHAIDDLREGEGDEEIQETVNDLLGNLVDVFGDEGEMDGVSLPEPFLKWELIENPFPP